MPKTARYEFEPDAPFGLPFRPTPFRASFTLTAGGTELHFERPVEFRYEGQQLEGEKRMELAVVPRLALRVTPSIAIVPAGRGATAAVESRSARHGRESCARARLTGQVRMDAPSGWTTTPPVQPVNFTREDEAQTVRFVLRPAAKTPLGQYIVKSVASVGRRDVRHRISDRRVPAHPPASARDSRSGRREGDGRPPRAESHRSATSWAPATRFLRRFAAWARPYSCSTPTSWRGAISAAMTRSSSACARTTAAKICAPTTSACSTTRRPAAPWSCSTTAAIHGRSTRRFRAASATRA